MTEHIVVVGASLAGLRTVQGLRRRESTARITMIGDEAELPYDRPPLSKSVLLGKAEPESLQFLDRAGVHALDVELQLSTPATGLDLHQRRVRLADDETIGFDHLVIATGSSPRGVPGLRKLDGVHVLRTLDDARRIRAGLLGASSLVVVGGGFIGCEIASSARELGLAVTVVDGFPTLMTRGLGTELGARMTDLHRNNGVELQLDAMVTGLAGDGAVEGVELADGTVIKADLVVVGIGTIPNVGWLEDSGLPLDNGVLCDEFLSAANGIYAVGDVARWINPHYGEVMRMEHWTSAGEQANAVATTLTGTPTPCSLLPYVWSDQFGKRLQIFGRIGAEDDIEIVFEEGNKFVALARRDGQLQGAVAYDALKAALPYRMQLMKPNP